MYCSLDDVLLRLAAEHLVALADDNDDGEADEAVVDAAIADADAEINAWLAPRYQTPFATAPAIVRWMSAVLAIERLYVRRRETPAAELRALVTEARELLGQLASGQADLREGAVSVGRPASDSTTRGSEPLFSAQGLSSF